MGVALRIAIVLVLMLAKDISAQTEVRTFSRFRTLLQTGERIEGREGRLTTTALEGISSAGAQIKIPMSDIRALDISAGSHMGKGAAIGASLGLLTGLLAIVQVSLREDTELKDDAAVGLTVGLTVGGGLIGALVGASYTRWERVHIPVGLSFYPEARGGRCTIRVSF